MKPAHERDRNSALSIARSRARSGDETGAARWLALARTFATPTRAQLAAHQRAILQGRGGLVIPGQIDISGRVHGH